MLSHRHDNQAAGAVALAVLGACACLGAAPAAARPLVDWDQLEPAKLYVEYLFLEEPARLAIDAVASFERDSHQPEAYPWILDSQSRKVRWTIDPEMQVAKTRTVGHSLLVDVDSDTLDLAPGHYEVYFATFGGDHTYLHGRFKELRKLFERRGATRHWQLKIVADDGGDTIDTGPSARPAFEALTRLRGEDADSFQTTYFELTAPRQLLVYAIGEASRGGFVDRAWIAEAKTRRKIWQLGRRNTKAAGGASKNRFFRHFVELDPGIYQLGYATDDTHHFPAWNVNPPYDPQFWGVAVFDPRGDVTEVWRAPVDDPFEETALVSILRQGDDSFETRYFEVEEPTRLHVRALGEYDDSTDQFVDFGWIEAVASRAPVWHMNTARSQHAGGADKNRQCDTVISLPAGRYAVSYVTDGSHAFGDWNAAPPEDPEGWGIRLGQVGDGRAPVRLLQADEITGGALAEILQVGDDEQRAARFTLDSKTRLVIEALGEGLEGEMFDYGWVRRLSSPERGTVWRMQYNDTEDAGGNHKNRRAVVELELEPGDYELRYKSDDSHAFGEWNAAPPDQPHLWGIRVYAVSEP